MVKKHAAVGAIKHRRQCYACSPNDEVSDIDDASKLRNCTESRDLTPRLSSTKTNAILHCSIPAMLQFSVIDIVALSLVCAAI